ncbi:hypothetical protein BKA70DRAFT_1181759 [Coprinopsis sp. MPI-PUGE-AT-0042]|nr:hypothetical protein BKA70DRAFT_1181759 [Coprinopsis sp. MPI-PUGE-AT-0042]
MSAYGAIVKSHTSGDVLPSTIWSTGGLKVEGDTQAAVKHISLHHLTLKDAQKYQGLVEYLRSVFAGVVEEGRTYPQEDNVTPESFESYFFSGDVLVGIAMPGEAASPDGSHFQERDQALRSASEDWEAGVAGFYYVKPNYPGRSSHICNGGSVVPPVMREKGYGRALAKSFSHYAPKLGYQASVFNLVYVNNAASVRLWEALGFSKAGLIPAAGRLKKKDGDGEEYVDAYVFYKSFQK